MKGIAIPLLIVATVILASISPAHTATASKVPFVGMTLAYSAIRGNETDFRLVNVLYQNASTNHVIIRDSEPDWFDVMEVDLTTRQILWWSGSFESSSPIYEEYWIPTEVDIGSHVPVLDFDAVVVGSTTLSVCGNAVGVWHLQASFLVPTQHQLIQDTWYYEKQTGILVAASFVILDSTDWHTVYQSWGGTLTSTNVSFPPGGWLMTDAATGSVYFIYPDYDPSHVKPNGAGAAALSDFTALGFVYGMTVNTQVNALDTSATYVTQSNGKPLVSGKGIVLVGGQAVHACVRYYENQRIAPVYPQVEGTMYYWYTKAGVKLTNTGMDSTLFGNRISYHQDMFIVENFADDSGNAVFVIYGYGWKGSFAGGEYFKSIIYPNIDSYTHAYYIFNWVDANGDSFPDINEITQVTSGD
jgi:hypothetical protein